MMNSVSFGSGNAGRISAKTVKRVVNNNKVAKMLQEIGQVGGRLSDTAATLVKSANKVNVLA